MKIVYGEPLLLGLLPATLGALLLWGALNALVPPSVLFWIGVVGLMITGGVSLVVRDQMDCQNFLAAMILGGLQTLMAAAVIIATMFTDAIPPSDSSALVFTGGMIVMFFVNALTLIVPSVSVTNTDLKEFFCG